MLVKSAVTPASEQVKLEDSPTARSPTVVSHAGASGSVTVTPVRSTSPVLATVMVNVAVPLMTTDWRSGVFAIVIAGAITSTAASSESETGLPRASAPATDAMLVKSPVTPVAVQLV